MPGGSVPPSVTDAELLDAFESTALPLSEWCHALHLRVAYLILSAASFDAALAKLREGIQAYNAAHAVPSSLESGYHETLTVCWLRLVAESMGDAPAGDSRAFHDAHPELHDERRVLDYYTRDHILTQRAKREFVEPNRRPLPLL